MCYFVELEFKRTELIFNQNQQKRFFQKNNLTFRIIDCNKQQHICSNYNCYGVPTILLTDKDRKQALRYNDEISALCERLTSFIIENTNIQPRNKYYLEIINDLTKEQSNVAFENRFYRTLSHLNKLNIINLSYVHQFKDLQKINQIIYTGRCAALALPMHGMIPFHTRLIFDSFYNNNNFYPIVIQNKNSYRIEENIHADTDLILFTNRGNIPVYINDSISNIVDFINYYCFVDGKKKLRQFVEMILYGETQKTLSLINENLMILKSRQTLNKTRYFFNISSNLTSFPNSQSNNTKDTSSSSSTQSSKSTNDPFDNLFLPFEFRYFAEDPEQLILFAKMMYTEENLGHVINSIYQLRKTIMHENIGKKIQKKLSQRIIILNIIKQIFFERFLNKETKNV